MKNAIHLKTWQQSDDDVVKKGEHLVFVLNVCLSRGSEGHLVQRASGDTKATRSVCRGLLERKISSLTLWEEVPRKTEEADADSGVHQRVNMHDDVRGRGSGDR